MPKKTLRILIACLVLTQALFSCNPPQAQTAGPAPLAGPTALHDPLGSSTQTLQATLALTASQGGRLSLPDGATVRFPAGALAADATVSIQAVLSGRPLSKIEDAMQTVGQVYKIDLGPQPPREPVTLEIPFDPSQLPSDTQPGQVFLSSFDEKTGQWVYAGGTVDTVRNVITLPVMHASYWQPTTWNWAIWPSLINNLLPLKLAGFADLVRKPSGAACLQMGQFVSVVQRDAQTLLQGCIEQDDTHNPTLRLINPRLIFYEIDFISGKPGYPAKQMFGPGDELSFPANPAELTPLVVSATLTQAAANQLAVQALLSLLPDFLDVTDLQSIKIRRQTIGCVAGSLSELKTIDGIGKALAIDHDSQAAVDDMLAFVQDGDSLAKLIKAATDCGLGAASTWSQTGALKIAELTSIFRTETDFLAGQLSGNVYGEVAFSLVNPPTSTPTSSPQPTATEAPVQVSSLRGKVLEHSACKYGPDTAFLYKYGILPNTIMNAIGRDADGNWLQVQAIGGNNPCWLKASLMQVDGDLMGLPDTYPNANGLPISPYFERVKILSISGGKTGTVTVEWQQHVLRPELGLDTGEGIEYLIEVWTCVNGNPAFYAVGYDPQATQGSFQIDNSCGVPTHADILGLDKEGFSLPSTIPIQ